MFCSNKHHDMNYIFIPFYSNLIVKLLEWVHFALKLKFCSKLYIELKMNYESSLRHMSVASRVSWRPFLIKSGNMQQCSLKTAIYSSNWLWFSIGKVQFGQFTVLKAGAETRRQMSHAHFDWVSIWGLLKKEFRVILPIDEVMIRVHCRYFCCIIYDFLL